MALFTAYATRRLWAHALERLAPLAHVTQWAGPGPVPRAELLRQVSDADALLCTAEDRIDADVIAAGARLRVIATLSAESAHIDVGAAAAARVVVCHTPVAADDAVADLTFALLLACARHLVEAGLCARRGEWQCVYPDMFLGTDLHGATLGIVGLGTVGIKVAQRALGFGMRVLYADTVRQDDAEQSLAVQYGALDDLLREADFVTLHVPPTRDTYHLIDARRLRLMKPTAYLIQMSAASVVAHDALVQAVQEGWIAGVGLDLYDREPPPAGDPLPTLPHVIVTPHIGANTRNTMATTMRVAADDVVRVLRGQRPLFPVWPEARAA
jgi:glyoxylate reductase